MDAKKPTFDAEKAALTARKAALAAEEAELEAKKAALKAKKVALKAEKDALRAEENKILEAEKALVAASLASEKAALKALLTATPDHLLRLWDRVRKIRVEHSAPSDVFSESGLWYEPNKRYLQRPQGLTDEEWGVLVVRTTVCSGNRTDYPADLQVDAKALEYVYQGIFEKLFESHGIDTRTISYCPSWWLAERAWKPELVKDATEDIRLGNVVRWSTRMMEWQQEAATALIRLRRNRESCLSLVPKDVVNIIAKMVIGDWKNAWDRLRIETDAEVGTGKEKYEEFRKRGIKK